MKEVDYTNLHASTEVHTSTFIPIWRRSCGYLQNTTHIATADKMLQRTKCATERNIKEECLCECICVWHRGKGDKHSVSQVHSTNTQIPKQCKTPHAAHCKQSFNVKSQYKSTHVGTNICIHNFENFIIFRS